MGYTFVVQSPLGVDPRGSYPREPKAGGPEGVPTPPLEVPW